MGVVASHWQTRAELRREMGEARPVSRADIYCSDALRIKRVTTLTVGTYFVVTESDVLFDEDLLALKRLDAILQAPWRNRVVESDLYPHPHRQFPLSTVFRVQLVHPEYRPEWGGPCQIGSKE